VLPGTLPKDIEMTHDNLNDGTSEGMCCPALRAFSVQYHPEAAPGPHDVNYLFEKFVSFMNMNREKPFDSHH
jgi:carbamoyl-phosphate synthase small subunit